MTKKNVDLIIRATDQASKDVKTITEAMKEFVDEQGDILEGSKTAESGLASLGASFKRLKNSVDGLNIGSKVTGEMNKASAATVALDLKIDGLSKEYSDLNKQLTQTSSQLVDVTRKTKGAASAEQAAKDKLTARTREQKKATTAMRDASAANAKSVADSKSFGSALAKANAGLDRAVGKYIGWKREILASGAATKAQQTGLDAASAAIKKHEGAVAGLTDDLERSKRAQSDAALAAARTGIVYNNSTVALERQATVTKKISANHSLLKQSTSALTGQQRKLESSVKRVSGALDKAHVKLAKVNAETHKNIGSTNSLSEAYRKLYGDSRKALSVTQRLRGQVLSLIAAYAGFYGVVNILGQVVGAYQVLEAAQARLNVVFRGDEGRVAEEMEFLRRTANRLGVDLGVLSQEYSKFSIATQNTSLEGAKTKKIFLSVAEAAVVNRSSVHEMSGVFVALTQIVSKGAVQMEELRQQLGDRLPGAIRIMADGLGVTTAELVKMMEQGQVTAEALVPFAEELERRFGPGLAEAMGSVTVQIGRMKNAIFQALVAFGNQGFLESFSQLMTDITETIQSADFEEFSSKLSVAFGTLAEAVGILIRNFDKLVIIVAGIIGVKLAPFLIAAAVGFGDLSAAVSLLWGELVAVNVTATASTGIFGRLVLSVKALTVGLKILLGATGIGLLVTAIAIGIGVWATSADTATEAMNAHLVIVDKVKAAYDEAGGEVNAWREAVEDLTELEININLTKLRKSFQSVSKDLDVTLGRLQSRFGRATSTNRAIRELREGLKDGTVVASDLKVELNNIFGGQFDDRTSKLMDRLFGEDGAEGQIDNATEFADAITFLEKTLVALTGGAEEAGEALAYIAGGVKDTSEVMAQEAVEAAEAYQSALATLNGELSETEVKLAEVLAGLRDTYNAAIDASANMYELADATDAYNAAVNRARGQSGLDAALGNNIVDKIIGVESGGDANAQNPNSTATGLGQFIESTWLNMFKTYFPDRAASLSDAMILELRKDAALSRQMVTFYVQENAKLLQTAGVAVNDATLYLAHFLGPNAAKEVLQAAPSTPVTDILSPEVISANQSILGGGTDVEQLLEWAARKVGISMEQLAVDKAIQEIETERVKAQEDFNTSQAEGIAQADFELSIAEQNVVARETAAALREAEIDAAEVGLELTEKQRAEIARITEEKFRQQLLDDRADATRDNAVKAEQKVNDLITERGTLKSQLEFATANGDTEKTADLEARIRTINTELLGAITNAQNMWAAVGGSGSEAAIAQLELARQAAANFGQDTEKVYLQWDRIGDMFVNKLARAFDNWSKRIAEGMSIWEATRLSFLEFAGDFLREIAQMILKQAIFNALKAAFGGASFGTLIGINHDGGMAGAGAQRSGVNPAVFSGALRYHEGGIAGLKPGELPVIVEKDEEILTRSDSRHVLNGGKSAGSSGSGASVVDLKVVIPMSPAEILREAVADRAGQEVLLEDIQNNSNEYKAALGIQ